jgi:2,5-dichloro-2,5-cyclohexadiene-1,4-diol dehydrogenase 1
MAEFGLKTFIVTGGLGSIGRAAAEMLVRAGAHVILTDLAEGGGHELAASLSTNGAEASYFAANLTDEDQVRGLIDHTLTRFGRLDGAFNNAGIAQPRKSLVELESEEWAHIMAVNVQSMFLCIKHQFLAMTDGGSIVNTSSGLGVVGSSHGAAYIASKHAVCGLTRAAAVEGAPSGIRVNAILPGTIRTPMFEEVYAAPEAAEAKAQRLRQHIIGRFGEPEDIAFLARWLLSDEAAFITGALYAADGGFTAL